MNKGKIVFILSFFKKVLHVKSELYWNMEMVNCFAYK